jgi:hypothetical protein
MVIAGLLALVAILAGLVAAGYIPSLAEGVLKLNPFEEETAQSRTTVRAGVEGFFREYSECKLSAETNCRCDISIPNIPSTYQLKLVNQGGNTLFGLYRTSDGEQLEIKEGEQFVVQNDLTRIPSDPDDDAINTDTNKIETSLFIPSGLLTLTGKIMQGDSVSSSLEVRANRGSYGLLGIYKINQKDTLFINEPTSRWYNPTTWGSGAQIDKSQLFYNLPECKTTDLAKIRLAKEKLDLFNQNYLLCLDSGRCDSFLFDLKGVEEISVARESTNTKITAIDPTQKAKPESKMFIFENSVVLNPNTQAASLLKYNMCLKYINNKWVTTPGNPDCPTDISKYSQIPLKKWLQGYFNYFWKGLDGKDYYGGIFSGLESVENRKSIQLQTHNIPISQQGIKESYSLKLESSECVACETQQGGTGWFYDYYGDKAKFFLKAQEGLMPHTTNQESALELNLKGTDQKALCEIKDLATGAYFILDNLGDISKFEKEETHYLELFDRTKISQKGWNIPDTVSLCYYDYTNGVVPQDIQDKIQAELTLIHQTLNQNI